MQTRPLHQPLEASAEVNHAASIYLHNDVYTNLHLEKLGLPANINTRCVQTSSSSAAENEPQLPGIKFVSRLLHSSTLQQYSRAGVVTGDAALGLQHWACNIGPREQHQPLRACNIAAASTHGCACRVYGSSTTCSHLRHEPPLSTYSAAADSQLSQCLVTCSIPTQHLPELPTQQPPTCCAEAQ
jgi:hypothetical protein